MWLYACYFSYFLCIHFYYIDEYEFSCCLSCIYLLDLLLTSKILLRIALSRFLRAVIIVKRRGTCFTSPTSFMKPWMDQSCINGAFTIIPSTYHLFADFNNSSVAMMKCLSSSTYNKPLNNNYYNIEDY